MIDDKARRTLRQTAKRGGAVSAGAIVVLLAGGSFALGSSGVDEAATAAPGLTGAAGSAGSAVSGVLPQPAPQASPGVGGLVDTVTDTVGDVGDTVDGLVNGEPTPEPTETITVPPKPGPGTKPPGVKPKPKPKPVTGAHTRAVAPTHVRVTHNARPGAAAGFRDRSGLDSVGSFGEQRANASVTPRLAPGSFDGLIAAPDLGSRGVPGVLVVIATAGVAALGASHLGIWYNRRSLSTS